MSVAVHSIFEVLQDRAILSPGIAYGRHWHLASYPVWSRDRQTSLRVEAARYPEPEELILKFSVFNATRSTPKTLRITSPGHAAQNMIVSSSKAHFISIKTPVHAPGAEQTKITLQLDSLDSPFKLGHSPDDRLLGLQIHSLAPPAPALRFPLDFTLPEVTEACLSQSWAAPEPGGTWSLGPICKIHIPGHLNPYRKPLWFDFDVLPRPSEQDPLQVSVSVNDRPLQRWSCRADMPPPQCPMPHDWTPGEALEITLEMQNPLSPLALGINEDPRPLGIWLKGVACSPIR